MASLYISYFGGVADECARSPLGSEVVTTSATSAQSTANPEGGIVAMLFSDTAHYIAEGANPTAAAGSGVYLPASTALWLSVKGGYKLAAITV